VPWYSSLSSCELPRLIEVGASCFFDPGYCHTANWQFSQNLRKRLCSARSRPTILLFFMLPVSAYLRFWYLLQRWYPGHEPHRSPGISIPVCGDPWLLDSGSRSNGRSGWTGRTYLLWQAFRRVPPTCNPAWTGTSRNHYPMLIFHSRTLYWTWNAYSGPLHRHRHTAWLSQLTVCVDNLFSGSRYAGKPWQSVSAVSDNFYFQELYGAVSAAFLPVPFGPCGSIPAYFDIYHYCSYKGRQTYSQARWPVLLSPGLVIPVFPHIQKVRKYSKYHPHTERL